MPKEIPPAPATLVTAAATTPTTMPTTTATTITATKIPAVNTAVTVLVADSGRRVTVRTAANGVDSEVAQQRIIRIEGEQASIGGAGINAGVREDVYVDAGVNVGAELEAEEAGSNANVGDWRVRIARAAGIVDEALIALDAQTGASVVNPGVSAPAASPPVVVAFDQRLLDDDDDNSNSNNNNTTTNTNSANTNIITLFSIAMPPQVPLEIIRTAPLNDILSACYVAFKSNIDHAESLVNACEAAFISMVERVNGSCLFACRCINFIHKLEQKVQAQALRTALLSLRTHSKSVCDTFDAFATHAQKEISINSRLIQSFPSDLQALHRIPIHPSIANSEDSKFLSDYIPEDRLLAWADKCRAAHELRTSTEMEINHGLDVDFEALEHQVSISKSHISNIQQPLKLLHRDFTRVQSILQDLQNRNNSHLSFPSQSQQTSNFLIPLSQTLSALENLQEIHVHEYIPAIRQLTSQVESIYSTIETSKIHSTSVLRSRLRAISHLQSIITSIVDPDIKRLSQMLATSLTSAFGQLLHVHRMPVAWGAVLVEIVRRREFFRIFVSRAEVFASSCVKFGEIERKLRERFDGEIGRYLPRDNKGRAVVSGLEDDVPKLEVKIIGKSDDSLPQISKSDIQDFEHFIAQVRAAMTDVDVSSSTAARSTNQTLVSSYTSSTTNSADSISKLQATITKMMPQIDSIGPEFDRIVSKSGICGDRISKLEEENSSLKAELALLKSGGNPVNSIRNATSVEAARRSFSTMKTKSAGNLESDYVRAQETLKSYENRIRELEDLLQTSFYDNRLAKSSSNHSNPSTDPNLQLLQTENTTLKTRLTLLESQFSTTNGSLQSREEQLKEVEKTRQNYEHENSKLINRVTELEKDIVELRNQLQEKDREGRTVVSEIERCALFVKEVSELVQECTEAFKVQSVHDGVPVETRSSSYPDNTFGASVTGFGPNSVVQPVKTQTSSAASSAGKYQSPTSPSVGLLALVNAAHAFNLASSIRTASGFGNLVQPLGLLTTLSQLRADEQTIRKRLRELQDDVRCQALELIGLHNEIAQLNAVIASESRNYDESDTATSHQYDGSYDQQLIFGDGRRSEEIGALATSPSRSGLSAKGSGMGQQQQQNKSFSITAPLIDELQTSKREIIRLNGVSDELSSALDVAKTETAELLLKFTGLEETLAERDAVISLLTDTISKLNAEKTGLVKSENKLSEKLGAELVSIQEAKESSDQKLAEASKKVEFLHLEQEKINKEWKNQSLQSSERIKGLESQILTLNSKLVADESSKVKILARAESTEMKLEEIIANLTNSVEEQRRKIDLLEANISANEISMKQKDVEFTRLEDLCERWKLSVSREKGKVSKLKEKVEDWAIVCKMSMECLLVRFETLGSVGSALAEMDMFLRKYIEDPTAVQIIADSADQTHPLLLNQEELLKVQTTMNISSSSSNSAGDENDLETSIESKMAILELRDTYFKIIGVIDSIDVVGWSENVINFARRWKESIITQNLRKSTVQGKKISYFGFKEGDLALFLPTRHPKAWAAFNVNAPHYFLSINSAETSFSVQIGNRDWILGIIKEIESRKVVEQPSTENSVPLSSENNPFGLAVGTKYFWCNVVPCKLG
ncbi:oligomeric, coiled-coil, peripheral membrane protein [Physocladia obscura]|uniref:Autophagy-related protein 11 n=1 Tax=Physocladia obscura TaxID=109957 RepID=A0AAD5XIH6_9FUNG|nr:oligomeric, coiled-coil, peripheral membrane protein [Physocladia obscura]